MKSKTKPKKSGAKNVPPEALPTEEEMDSALREIDKLRLTHGPTPTEIFRDDRIVIRKLKTLISSRKTPDPIRIRAAQALNSYLDRHYKANNAFPPEKLQVEVRKLIEL